MVEPVRKIFYVNNNSVSSAVSDHTVRIATIGAAFSANKGAASMLRATIDDIRRTHPHAEFDVLTTYPEVDRLVVDDPKIRVVSLTPIQLAGLAFPLGVLAALSSFLKIPRRFWARTTALRALCEADVVIDLAGISFVSGRGTLTLGYNVLMTGLPLLFGRPVVKGSQAMGPFTSPAVRFSARKVLPRLSQVTARGDITHENLKGLSLQNVVSGADLAFLLNATSEDQRQAEILVPIQEKTVVGVVPSQVVCNYSERTKGTYVQDMVQMIDALQNLGHQVVLLPHSIQLDKPASKMNDLPLTQEICAQVSAPPLVVDTDESPGTLRAIIERCDLLITSRFHAMISSLATATPTLVIGWSHKYREVLAQFDQDDAAIDYRDLKVEEVVERCELLLEEKKHRSETIRNHLPKVTESARSGLKKVLELIS